MLRAASSFLVYSFLFIFRLLFSMTRVFSLIDHILCTSESFFYLLFSVFPSSSIIYIIYLDLLVSLSLYSMCLSYFLLPLTFPPDLYFYSSFHLFFFYLLLQLPVFLCVLTFFFSFQTSFFFSFISFIVFPPIPSPPLL